MAIPQPAKTPGKTDWFVHDRIGLFIHWGIYAAATRHEWVKNRDIRKYAEYLHGQVCELLTVFGKIDILWTDFSYSNRDWGWSKGKGKEDWQSEKLIKMVREIQPDIIMKGKVPF